MTLAKLKAGPFRRGRGGNADEVNRKEQESVERDSLLRAAVLELCESVEALEEAGAGGTSVHRETFSYLNATASSRFAPFAGNVTELATVAHQNIWRAPFAGSVTRVSLVTSGAGGATRLQWHESDGTTLVGSLQIETLTAVTVETGTAYSAVFDFDDVTVTAGGLYALEIDPDSTIDDVSGWLEVTPS